jgi:type IV pilus assembly protein PilB
VTDATDVTTELPAVDGGGDGAGGARIGELLVAAGVLRPGDVGAVLAGALPDERFGDAVVRLRLATEDDIADAIATQLRLPRVDVGAVVPPEAAVQLVPSWLAARHGVLPLRVEDDELVVATDDPSDVSALDDVRMASGARVVRPEVASTNALALARRRVYRDLASSNGSTDAAGGEVDPAGPGTAPDEDGSVAALVDTLIADAVGSRGSDLHLAPDDDGVRVRVRVDGLLRDVDRVPAHLAAQVTSRVKILAQLDIAEKRLPQDGRARVEVGGEPVDLRVSTMPTLDGEAVVVRLLPQGDARLGLDELGLDRDVQQRLRDALARPQGLVLVTGPTGSGKTSTLYAALTAASDPTRNVLTLEDPVEYRLAGANQTQIDPAIGLTFARGLRHVLRQDPDVVLVGEIRDAESAQLAVEAASTGHLVLATLHTNDAAACVARLIDLDVDRFLAASALELIVAQRLVRRVCEGCAEVDEPDVDVLRLLRLPSSALEGVRPRRGRGCARCAGTGEQGRLAVAEVLEVDATVRELIGAAATEAAIARAARTAGMTSMREAALRLAAAGTITYAEALRATPDPGLASPVRSSPSVGG